MGNTVKQCRLGLFQDSDFAGDLEDSRSTSDGTLCVFGSHTFVPISWMCKKQSSVSYSSTESEIISLDAGLRLNGITALDLSDLIVSVFGSVSHVSDRSGQPDNDVHKRQKSQRRINVVENIDSVLSNVQSARQKALLYVFEDNEAVIKMIIKGRSPTMRHVSRTHRVALDWLFDRINLDPKIQIKYIDTKKQLANMLTKGNSHVTNGIIFCVCLTSAVSVLQSVLKWCRKEHKKNQVKKESQQSRDQWWIWSREAVKGLHPRYLLLHQKARWKPDTKVKLLWVRKMRSIKERGDPLFAHNERLNHVLLMTARTSIRKKMKVIKERGDPLFAHSERINSLLKMMRHNQNCR